MGRAQAERRRMAHKPHAVIAPTAETYRVSCECTFVRTVRGSSTAWSIADRHYTTCPLKLYPNVEGA